MHIIQLKEWRKDSLVA